jgi:predicted chitinase
MRQTIEKVLDEFGVTDKFLRAAILANIEKESGLKPIEENLNYSRTSNERIRKIFTTRVSHLSDSELDSVKKNVPQFAELIYGHNTRIGKGMGNLQEGDGWMYRGRGFIQITGRANYKRIGDMIGVNLVQSPDLLISDPSISAKASIQFIMNDLSKKSGFTSSEEANRAVTQVIGGRGLSLNAGYGKELLDKVNSLSKKYLTT